MTTTYQPIAILGAGSWGTAIGLTLARRGQTVHIWSIETSEITAMQEEKYNNRYLPGIPLPDTLIPMLDLEQTVRGVKDIVMVVPSAGYRATLEKLLPLSTVETRILCAAKGLDGETGELLGQVTAGVMGAQCPFAVLSGPSFAKEVAMGLPVAVDLASANALMLRELTERFDQPLFNIHPCTDVVGVELGGVVKNVLAVGTGLIDGLELGASARSAFMTQGLHEMIRLGVALGANPETFFGLSGIGDMILTCTDDLSRNRRLGLALGRGKSVTEAEQEIGQAIEGKRNADTVSRLAARLKVNMPICNSINLIVQGKIQPESILPSLLAGKSVEIPQQIS